MRAILLACAFALTVLPAVAGEKDVIIPGTAQTGTVSSADIDARIEKAAQDAQARGDDVTRYELFDLAVPGSASEYKAVAGFSIMLVVAVARDAGELPLRRAYIQTSGKITALRQVYAFSHDTGAGSAARRVFGRAREFAFYLVPTAAMLTEHDIRCDMAKSRKALLLGTLHIDPPGYMTPALAAATPAKPSPAALLAFLKSQYPGLTAGLTETQLK
jgi:hypothetical protein